MYKKTATKNDEGRSLLKYLEKTIEYSNKSEIQKLFRKKDIKINGTRIKDKSYLIKEGDIIEVYGAIENKDNESNYVKGDIEIHFEDENILIVNKEINLEVHGPIDCLDNRVLSYLKHKKIDSFIPSHMGRLDKLTSGLMVYAKNYKTLRELKDKQGNFVKIYKGISTLKEEVDFKANIFHNEMKHKQEISYKFGKECRTLFKPLNRDDVLEIVLHTGRKHQIRASLEELGHPLKGDIKYGGIKAKRLFLHSEKIIFKNLGKDLDYLNNKEFSIPSSF